MDLENTFKKPDSEGGLGINRFFDYDKKTQQDIENILLTKFKNYPNKARDYAKMIIRNSKEYRDALDKLKIQY